MATDEFINHWRKQKREREFANEHFEIKSNEAENDNEEIIKYRKKMQLILSGLGERQRSVFLMNKMDGLTISEIANYLGLSVKAVEKRMTQAWKYIKLEAGNKQINMDDNKMNKFLKKGDIKFSKSKDQIWKEVFSKKMKSNNPGNHPLWNLND